MKTTVTCLSIFVLSLTATAQTEGKADAANRATILLRNKGARVPTRVNEETVSVLQSSNNRETLYICNTVNNSGFVILSEKDDHYTLLAYSDESSFETSNNSTFVQSLISDEISRVSDMPYVQHEEKRDTVHHAIPPLLATRWGEGSPYNFLCLLPNGKKAVCGSATVAMAQVMNYHKRDFATTEIPGYVTQSGDSYDVLQPTTLRWQGMRNSYPEDADCFPLSTIYLYIARAMETSFGSNYSKADIQNMANCFSNYFGYNSLPTLLSHDNYTHQEWGKIIYHELECGRPVIYTASNSMNETHTFVIDGYDGDGMFHVNWGMDGSCNGYYRLNGINLSSQSTANDATTYGFTSGHYALVGVNQSAIEENDWNNTSTMETVGKDIEVIQLQQVRNSTSKKIIRMVVGNNGNDNYTGELRLRLGGRYYSTENVYLAALSEDSIDFYFNADEGCHAIDIVDRKSNKSIYHQECLELFDFSDEDMDVQLVSSYIPNIDHETRQMTGEHFYGEIVLANHSDISYQGNVVLTLNIFDDDSGIVFQTTKVRRKTTAVNLNPGETCTIVIQSEDLSVGNRFFYTIDTEGGRLSGGNTYAPIHVKEGATYWDANGKRYAMPVSDIMEIPHDAVAIDLRGIDIESHDFMINDNPNTLYYVDFDTNIPAIFEDVNVIYDFEMPQDLKFIDGYGYYVPYAFDVKGMVSYSRSTDSGSNDIYAWDSVTLPFSVQDIMVDGVSVEWGKNQHANTRGVQICELKTMKDSIAIFSDIGKWQPNVPYIFSQLGKRSAELLFCASNTRIFPTTLNYVSTNCFLFEGKTNENSESVFALHENGYAFARRHIFGVKPFRCYFKEKKDSQLSYKQIHIKLQGYQTGDVNADGVVNIIDVLMTINAVMGETPLGFRPYMADVNYDGTVSVADVVGIINMVVNGE